MELLQKPAAAFSFTDHLRPAGARLRRQGCRYSCPAHRCFGVRGPSPAIHGPDWAGFEQGGMPGSFVNAGFVSCGSSFPGECEINRIAAWERTTGSLIQLSPRHSPASNWQEAESHINQRLTKVFKKISKKFDLGVYKRTNLC